MIFIILILTLSHPYFKENIKGVDSCYFYKEKIKWIFEKEKKLNFEVNKRDSFLIFKNKMFKELKRGVKEKNYYKYVYEKDNLMFLLYLFKREEFEKIKEILENKEIKKPEEYIIYLLTCLKLNRIPNILENEKFINSPYFPYILYLNSIFLFKKNENEKVLKNLEKIKDYEELGEDVEFLMAISDINKIENYLKKYEENFYTDTLYFILANYYKSIKKYKTAKEYIIRLYENKKFYKSSLGILIEIESLIGEKIDTLIKIYEKEFGKNGDFKEILRKVILNLYSRKKFKEVIEIYEKWGEIIKQEVFAVYISSLLREKEIKRVINKIKIEENRYLKGLGYFKIGENYENSHKYLKAIYFYENSLKYIDKKSQLYENIFLKKILLEVKIGRISNLEIAYKIFLEKFPQSIRRYEILKEIVNYLLEENRFSEALNYQKKIFEIKKERGEFDKLIKIAINAKNYAFIDSLYENFPEYKDIIIFYKVFLLYKIKKDPFAALEVSGEIEEDIENEYTKGVKYYIAEIYKILGKLRESENLLKDIIQGDDTISFKGIIMLYEIHKEKEEVNKMEELCAKTSFRWEDERKGHILFRLAETKEIKGENEEAKRIYLLAADYLLSSLDSVSLSLYRAASLTNLKEEKRAFLERAKMIAKSPLLKEEIDKSLIDLEKR
ncbi:MAG: hypothetical protein ABIM36_00120 [candidate division WOR-3 bacterium]